MEKPKRFDWRWTVGKRKRFIAALAETFDAEAACAASELTWQQVCVLFDKVPEFLASFRQTIEIGYDLVELALVREARANLVSGTKDAMSVAAALLRQRKTIKAESRARTKAPGAPAGKGARRRRPKSRDETVESILDHLGQIKTTRGRGADAGDYQALAGRLGELADEEQRRGAETDGLAAGL